MHLIDVRQSPLEPVARDPRARDDDARVRRSPRARCRGRRGCRSSTCTRSEMIRRIGSTTSQTLTFMPATTRSPASQNAMNSRAAGSPRNTTRSQLPAKPEYSMPTSYWSEKKYGRRSRRSARPSMLRAAAGPWWSAFAQCSTRIRLAVERVLRVGHVAGGEHAGALVRSCSSTRIPFVDRDPGLGGEPVRGSTPMPTTTKSQSSTRPSPVRTRSTAVAPRTPRRRSRAASARRGRRGCRGRSRRPRRRARAPAAPLPARSPSPRRRAAAPMPRPPSRSTRRRSRRRVPPRSSRSRSASESATLRR